MKSVRIILGFGLSAICIVGGIWLIDWPKALVAFARVRWEWVAVSALLLTVGMFCFSLRWRQWIGVTDKIGVRQAFGYVMIGYMTNAVLPFRSGDILRAALIYKRHGFPMAKALSGIALERLIDILSVVFLGILLTRLIDLPGPVTVGLQSLGFLSFAGLAGAVFLSLRFGFLVRPLGRIEHLSVVRAVLKRLDQFADGLAILHQPRHLMPMLIWNVLGWTCFAVSMMAMLVAMQLAVPIVAALLVIVVVSLGAAIPSSPGSIGVYHALVVLALSVWEVPAADALAFALVSHATAIGLHIGLGAISASVLGIHHVLRQAKTVDAYTGAADGLDIQLSKRPAGRM